MPQKLTDTATLQCDQGTTPSKLTVTSQDFCKAEDKLIATEKDKQPNANIKPFGQCKLKPSSGGYLPCMPAPTLWQKTAKKDEINGFKILTDDSTCQCSIGGKIAVQNKGHSERHEVE
jgi:Domain of unknown function (DUF4280)